MTEPADVSPRARAMLPRGFADRDANDLAAAEAMIAKIGEVYALYGFEAVETPFVEYTDALGKFLPDQDRPNEGVFSFKDDDEQWLSLRYDLTAPLARYVAQNYQTQPKPFRRYAVGNVWRNEKPGPGRFRQFMQFDADTVGAESVAADAEMCMLAADTLEALGLKGKYVIKVSSRKIFDGVLEAINVTDVQRRLTILRAIDKYDRLGLSGVRELLGKGRKDESGDFTKGAELTDDQASAVLGGLTLQSELDVAKAEAKRFVAEAGHYKLTGQEVIFWRKGFPSNKLVDDAFDELRGIEDLVRSAGYDEGRISINPTVVRGLEYYTGPVFEAELTFEVKDEKGNPVRFGSVGGGGRYDDLVARFTGQKVPATGFSIGVSRLQAALAHLNKDKAPAAEGPVIVTVMEKDRIADYQKLVQTLRNAGIRAELYLGNPKKFGKQLEYADKRGSPCVVIQGSNERDANPPQFILKDMIEGAKAAAAIADNKEWKETRPAQVSVKEADLVAEVRKILARHAP
jgi:histidyl-tRNA synthetase